MEEESDESDVNHADLQWFTESQYAASVASAHDTGAGVGNVAFSIGKE